MDIISGNSIIPCPIATKAPAWGELLPFPNVTAVIGPGAMTPDKEINTASKRKVKRDIFFLNKGNPNLKRLSIPQLGSELRLAFSW